MFARFGPVSEDRDGSAGGEYMETVALGQSPPVWSTTESGFGSIRQDVS